MTYGAFQERGEREREREGEGEGEERGRGREREEREREREDLTSSRLVADLFQDWIYVLKTAQNPEKQTERRERERERVRLCFLRMLMKS